jgi:hypothetical protein
MCKVASSPSLLSCLHESIAIDLVYGYVGVVWWSVAVQQVCRELYAIRNVIKQISGITRLCRIAARLLNCYSLEDHCQYRLLLTVQASPLKMTQDSVLLVIGTQVATTQRIFSTLGGIKTIGLETDDRTTGPRAKADKLCIDAVPGYNPQLVVTKQVSHLGSLVPATHVFIDSIGRDEVDIRTIVLVCANCESTTAVLITLPESDHRDKEWFLDSCGLLGKPRRVCHRTEPELFLVLRLNVQGSHKRDRHWVYGIELTDAVRTRVRKNSRVIPGDINPTAAYHSLCPILPLSQVPRRLRNHTCGGRILTPHQQAMLAWRHDRDRRLIDRH